MVVEKIAKAEGLENSSQLFVDADNFDLMFTSDFNWANDGAIRFLYGQNQKYYSAQLRMFHDDNKYFITDISAIPLFGCVEVYAAGGNPPVVSGC